MEESVPIKINILSRLFIVHLHYQNMSNWPRLHMKYFLSRSVVIGAELNKCPAGRNL